MHHRRRFDWLEVLLVACLTGIVAWTLAVSRTGFVPPAEPEAAALGRAYGPNRHSEHEEEWIVRDFFKDRRGGVFVDVGANDYMRFSNTYYLEHELGWSGIAIEPQQQFAAGYAEHRPRTRFRPFFVSDQSDQEATLYVTPGNDLVASARREFTSSYGKASGGISVPTITLNDLLAHESITRIDFLTMDIELSEPRALAGFDIERFAPALVCVEAHPEVRQQILDYFAAHHYVLVGRYLRADSHNLYFMPYAAKNPADGS